MTPQIIRALIHPKVDPSQLVATKWSSVEDKAWFADKLLDLIASGFPEKKFTERLYRYLSNSFFMIAHFDKHGFMAAQLSTPPRQLAFVTHLATYRAIGDPEFTFSDVEAVISQRLANSGVVEHLAGELARKREDAERQLLASLQAKYEGKAVPEPRLTPPPPLETDVAVLRRRLEKQSAASALQPSLF